MTATALERNKTYFEQLTASMPGEVQGFVKGILSPFEWLLEQVAGDPDDLMRGAERCQALAEEVRQIAQSQLADRRRLAEAWSGETSTAFQGSMQSIEEAIDDLGQGLDGAKTVLVDAANASVDAFNLLCELIFEFILWFVAELIVALAVSVVSFGASLAAWAARTLARLAITLGRGAKIVAKCAQVLMRLASKLDDVVRLLKKYKDAVMALRQAKKAYKPWKAATYTKEGLAFRVKHFATMFPGKVAINVASPVNIPGFAGAATDAVVGAVDLQDGRKDRNYVMDGTYSEDIGKYSKTLQDALDTLF